MVRTLALCHNAIIFAKYVYFNSRHFGANSKCWYIKICAVKQGLAGFYYLIRTMGILQGRYLSTRGGFAPFLQSRVVFSTFILLNLCVTCNFFMYILSLFFFLCFCGKGDDSGSFCLKYNKYSEIGSSKGTKTAKYSVAFQYLLLEGITEVDDEQWLIL